MKEQASRSIYGGRPERFRGVRIRRPVVTLLTLVTMRTLYPRQGARRGASPDDGITGYAPDSARYRGSGRCCPDDRAGAGRHVGQRVFLAVNGISGASPRYARSGFSLPCRRTRPMLSLVNWHPRPALLTLQQSSAEANSTPCQPQVRYDRASQSAETAGQLDSPPTI